MSNKIFFTCLILSKNGVKVIETEHIIRPLTQDDCNTDTGLYQLPKKEFAKLYGNLIIEKVKILDGTIRNVNTDKKYLEKEWCNECPSNVIESKIWHHKNRNEIKSMLIKKMDSFLLKWKGADFEYREKLKDKWNKWKHSNSQPVSTK